jgi:tetratricopeptide (TPR) repeat protein
VSLELLRRQDPHDFEVLTRLENIYENVGDYALLVQMLLEKFDGNFPLDERIEAAIRSASVYETHLNNYPAAIAIARRAFELAPKNAHLIDELIRLYYLAEDWANLVTAMVHKAGLATEIDEKIAILTSAADIADTKLGDLARAGEIADVIIKVVPDNTHANLIQARRLEQQGRTGEALLKFRKLAIDAQDSKDGVEALVGLARLGLAVGDTGKDVEEALEAIMAVNPEHKEANVLLKTLLEKTRNFKGLVALLEREIERVTDESELAKMSFEIAEIYLNKLNSAEKFIEWADKAYQLKPDNPKIVAGIVNFYLRSGERQRSIPYLEWLVNYLEGKRRLRELPPYAHELGKTFEEIGELDKAILYYRLCHEYDAANMINGMALARLYMNQGEHDKALRIFQPLILKMDSLKAADREVLLLSLAEIYVARNDKRRASQYVMRVLSENPDNKDAQKMLEKGL